MSWCVDNSMRLLLLQVIEHDLGGSGAADTQCLAASCRIHLFVCVCCSL
jgi:hypothetical protein